MVYRFSVLPTPHTRCIAAAGQQGGTHTPRSPQEGSETRTGDLGSFRWTPQSAETLQGGRIHPSFWEGAQATPREETRHLGLPRLAPAPRSKGFGRAEGWRGTGCST